MTAPNTTISKKALWAGYILSALTALLMLFSAVMKLMKPADVVKGFAQFGYPDSMIIPLGLVEITCAVIYIIPRTSVLGAILLTGYLGGAVATTARLGEPFVLPLVVGVFVWGGLFLRDARLRELIPLRR